MRIDQARRPLFAASLVLLVGAVAAIPLVVEVDVDPEPEALALAAAPTTPSAPAPPAEAGVAATSETPAPALQAEPTSELLPAVPTTPAPPAPATSTTTTSTTTPSVADHGPRQEGCEARPAVRVVRVSTADQLHEALDDVAPGDRIDLGPGRYVGQFVARTSGTPDRRIALCGGPDAVLLVGSVRAGTALQLRASYWDVVGFTITTAQSGLTVVGGSFNELSGLTVWNTGHEAVKLRSFSTENRVVGNAIHTTGKSDRDFGEGIYVGSAVNNWCAFSSCRVDRSDGNHIEGNRIWSTAAEAIDVKEGTTGGRIVANEFDGEGSSALSWVDVKGNGWMLSGNRGTTSSTDGFRTAVAVAGWGKGNTFEGNVADTRADGYGIRVTKDNVVRCDNVAPTAGRGVSNVACTPAS